MGKGDIIGHKVETISSNEYVTKIWCKLCAKYKDQVVKHPTIKGAAVKAFTEGTESVTKFQVITLFVQ